MARHRPALAALLLSAACSSSGGGSTPHPDAAGQTTPDAAPLADARIDATTLVTIAGTVVDNNGLPLLGAKIAADGRTATTGADGKFTILVARTPYDLMVGAAGGSDAVVLLDLTRLDPVVQVPVLQPPLGQATLQGSMPALPADSTALVSLILDDNVHDRSTAYSFYFSPAAMYSQIQYWAPHDTAATGTLYLFQFKSSAEMWAADYLGYAQSAFTLQANGTTTLDVPALGAVQTQTVTANITLPGGGWGRQETFALARAGGKGARMIVNQRLGTAAAAVMKIPILAGATYEVYVRAHDFDTDAEAKVRRAVAPGGSVSFTTPLPATMTAPAADATDVAPGTSFTFTSDVAVNQVWLTSPGKGPRVIIVTAKKSFALPDVALVGVTIPPGTSYGWEVHSSSERTSVDAFADAELPDNFCGYAGPQGGDYDCAITAVRAFVTKP